MKKIFLTLIVLLATFTIWGKEYNLNQTESINIDSFDKIIFEISAPGMIAGFSSFDIDSLVEGNSTTSMDLSLEGTIYSNRVKAVPEIITDESGSTLKISLYPQNSVIFGAVTRGLASFTATIPDSFEGSVEVVTSSTDLEINNLIVEDFLAYASSGDIDVDGITARDISIRSSSGELTVDNLDSTGEIELQASSGDINIGQSTSEGDTEIELSSGNLYSDYIKAENLTVKSSSGSLEIGTIECDNEFFIKASSGDIELEEVNAYESRIESSSGSIDIEKLSGGVSHQSSSGEISIGFSDLTRDIELNCSSGRVKVYIPEGSSYDLDLKTNAGRISVDDQVLMSLNDDNSRNEIVGSVNNGGVLIKIRCSSGNITIENR